MADIGDYKSKWTGEQIDQAVEDINEALLNIENSEDDVPGYESKWTAEQIDQAIEDINEFILNASSPEQNIPEYNSRYTGTQIDDAIDEIISEGILTHADIEQSEGYSTRTVMSQYAVSQALATKQENLVSGQNIKTIDGETLLGEGDLKINGNWKIHYNKTQNSFTETVPEIISLIRNNKDIILVDDEGLEYKTNQITDDKIIFSSQKQNNGVYLLELKFSYNATENREDFTFVSEKRTAVQDTALLDTEITSEADNAHYPSSKAVYDIASSLQELLAQHANSKNNPHGVTKSQVGLGNVDNTADIDKIVSNPQQQAINAVMTILNSHKATTNNPHNVTKAQVGLSEADNTSDLDKPLSTAAIQALQEIRDLLTEHKNSIDNPHHVTKAQIGLGNVENTSDLDKPISTATQEALDELSNTIDLHAEDDDNPHNVTKAQVGLGNVDNTSDAAKPVSTAQQAALDLKLNKANASIDVAKDIDISVTNDNVSIDVDFQNLNTGATSQTTTAIPLATSETGGLMSSADYAQIRENTARIEQLEGRNIRLTYTAGSSPTANQIKAFVLSSGYTDTAMWTNTSVVVRATNHIWKYYSNTQTWQDDGLDTVTQFTNEIAGIIKGSATDGKVYAETDGTGSVYGWDNLTNTVSDLDTNKVDKTTTVAGKALSSNITLASTDLTDTTDLVREDDNISRLTNDANYITNSTAQITESQVTGLVNDLAGKQDALTTQTAYTAKGSASKIPTITTNSLGQVTEITESNIYIPEVDQTFSSSSANAQSGTAVAGAISSKQDKIITMRNITVPASSWVADTTNDGYNYKAEIEIEGLTAQDFALVFVSDSGTFPENETTTGKLILYNKSNTVMTIPLLLIIKGVE